MMDETKKYEMRSNYSREYFKECGLDYSILTDINLEILELMINTEIMKYRKRNDINPIILKCFRPKKKRGDCNALCIKGTYFSEREAVTFNHSGFIGFCEEMSGYNRIPIIDGFINWCDYIKEEKE